MFHAAWHWKKGAFKTSSVFVSASNGLDSAAKKAAIPHSRCPVRAHGTGGPCVPMALERKFRYETMCTVGVRCQPGRRAVVFDSAFGRQNRLSWNALGAAGHSERPWCNPKVNVGSLAGSGFHPRVFIGLALHPVSF